MIAFVSPIQHVRMPRRGECFPVAYKQVGRNRSRKALTTDFPTLWCSFAICSRTSMNKSRNYTTTCSSSPPSHSSSSQGLTYESSGVSIDGEAASVAALISSLKKRPAARTAGENGALVPHPGGFSGLIEFGDQYLALCTDGVGSKLLLASQLDQYAGVAIDCVAMNVNDLLCVGAEPLAFVDYVAAPKPDPKIWAALGDSLATACTLARVSLCGGETASLPDIVSHVDMSGTALGSVPRGLEITGRAVRPTDALIGLPSSGIHSNGFSLVRRVVSQSRLSLTDPVPFTMAARDVDRVRRFPLASSSDTPTLGEVLLTPTRIYVDPVWELLSACRSGEGPCGYDDIHGLVHITGGGLSNLLRLNGQVGFDIDDALPVLPEFDWLCEQGGVSQFEMWRTFNMGMGFCIAVSDGVKNDVVDWLERRLPGSRVVGCVTAETGIVQHKEAGVSFDRY